jgi:hypothetical protein
MQFIWGVAVPKGFPGIALRLTAQKHIWHNWRLLTLGYNAKLAATRKPGNKFPA